MIAVALARPGTPHAAACLHGRQLGCTDRGWLHRPRLAAPTRLRATAELRTDR